MRAAKASRERWSVVCPDYTLDGFKSREAAERSKERIEAAGHCRHDHKVVAA